MGLPVRVVCNECLRSLEYSSGDGSAPPASCPMCGAPIDPSVAPEAEFGGEFGLSESPGDFEAPTPRVDRPARASTGKIGRFVLRETLGEGGYGQVYRAYDAHLDREVALKVLKPDRIGDKALERFYREARAAARLDHPNIVALYDAGRDEGRCWIAYQLVPGRTLSLIRDVDRPSVDSAVRIVRELALALDHAHGRGVFHRDLKPANVLVDDTGRARLTDFGLARRGDVDSDLTREGTILGTPQYMSPEAAAGRAHQADARSDVYSLGVILYELLCGRRPSDVPSNAPLWRSTRLVNPPTPRSVDRAIPSALDKICMKALAFRPEDRYPDARSLADALAPHVRKPIERPQSRSRTLSRAEPTRPPAGRRTLPTWRGMALGLVVAVSVACLTLGMSFRLAGPPPTASAGEAVAVVRPFTVVKPVRITTVPTRTAEPEPKPDVASAPTVVFLPPSGEKYHESKNCRYLHNSDEMSIVEVANLPLGRDGAIVSTVLGGKSKRYLPCSTCFPRGVSPPLAGAGH